ncbi:helix-turn-helix transcriptional regulator [Spirosoma radiotolerans]|uniref:helix-turn-helix transcriptional regulator n=1 Tax=Spirosoma radiotolerans TaxID=1379870 RepID=UPI00062742FD|nr:helix-turn-helix transcriptional regulator [Spirosoma radiotolerans]
MQTPPLQLDLFALIIFLGVAQGLFLGIFFLTGERRGSVANRCLGYLMLSLSAVIGEMFLCYSNYMFRLLAFVDFSEPLNFAMGPLFFLFVFARIRGRLPKRWLWHFVPAALWAINAVSWLYQPVEVKYNNYLNAYHPELPFAAEPAYYIPEDFFNLRDYIDEMTLLSCLIYNILALILIHQAYRQADKPFWQNSPIRLAQLRNQCMLFLILPALIVIIKPQFYEDLGDYLLACYLTLIIYSTSIRVMAGSNYFIDEPEVSPPMLELPTETKKKYEKSALSEEVEDAVLGKLNRLLEAEKPYLDSDMSLPKLAARLDTSPHNLSQLLNDRLGQTFFDWLATYRIAEAQRLLNEAATANLKIDEIAERVGYNSPSAFHTAFKRLTNQTPAQYRQLVTRSVQTGPPSRQPFPTSSRSA